MQFSRSLEYKEKEVQTDKSLGPTCVFLVLFQVFTSVESVQSIITVV